MPVKIVTDSGSDISPKLARALEITIVPLYLRFGEETYRDGIDISPDDFYRKLEQSPVHPSTSQPAPSDFADAYRKLSEDADEIVSIHLSSKLSGTYSSALQGRDLARTRCQIEVVDSLSITMGLGLTVIAAARLAKAGESLQRIIEEVRQAIQNMRLLGVLDTLKYLVLGGRIGKSKALLGSLLNVKPVLTMRDGELAPAGLARTRNRGVERLFDFVKNALSIQELAIVYSTFAAEADSIRERVSSIIGEEQVHLARLGPTMGVHGGPGTLILALREKVRSAEQEAGEGEHLKKRISLPSLHIPHIPGLKFSCP